MKALMKGFNYDARSGFIPDFASWKGKLDFVCVEFNNTIGQTVPPLQESIDFYLDLVRRASAANITTIVRFTHQTYGNGKAVPWEPWKTSSWENYWELYALACCAIAEAFRKHPGLLWMAQFGNEPDINGHSAVPMTAPQYAAGLRATLPRFKATAPSIPMITAGFANGPVGQADYWRAVKRAYPQANDYIDYVGCHLYGRYDGAVPAISTQWFPDMSFSQALAVVAREAKKPLLLTEIGVSEEQGFPPSEYPAIANYMQRVFTSARAHPYVAGLSWWSYSEMRGGGIIDGAGNPKPHIHEAFTLQRTAGNLFGKIDETLPIRSLLSGRTIVTTTNQVNIRAGRSENTKAIGRLENTGAAIIPLDCVRDNGSLDESAMDYKLKRADEWIAIQTARGVGYVAARLMRWA